MFSTLLVMLALNDNDQSVIDAVVAGAAAMGCKRLVVAHVFNEDPLTAPLADVLEPEDHTSPAEIDEAAEELSRRLPEVEVTGVACSGVPEAEIERLVREHGADLVVMGRNPVEGDQPGWGSSGSKLLRLAPCSVLIVPRGSSLDLSAATVGLDFSKCSMLAMKAASKLTDEIHAVYHFNLPRARRSGTKKEELVSKIEVAARKHLADEVIPLMEDRDVTTLNIVGEGKVAEALIDQAGRGLLVVGSKGITPVAYLLLGSAANRVAARALGPVLVIREKEAPAAGLLERMVSRR